MSAPARTAVVEICNSNGGEDRVFRFARLASLPLLSLDPLDLAQHAGEAVDGFLLFLVEVLQVGVFDQDRHGVADAAELAAVGADVFQDLRLDFRRARLAEIDVDEADLAHEPAVEFRPGLDELGDGAR